ncbi:MAG: hypothetical protein H7239_06480 [Flavobacterium sp.]|nr:hypothetical protein [Flavobacterium sp.]
MEALEIFIKKRMQQSEFSAMMIPRYLEKPHAFLGSKNFTLEQGKDFEKDAEKCKAILHFLKDYNKQIKQKKCGCKRATFTRTVDADFNCLCGKCGHPI